MNHAKGIADLETDIRSRDRKVQGLEEDLRLSVQDLPRETSNSSNIRAIDHSRCPQGLQAWLTVVQASSESTSSAAEGRLKLVRKRGTGGPIANKFSRRDRTIWNKSPRGTYGRSVRYNQWSLPNRQPGGLNEPFGGYGPDRCPERRPARGSPERALRAKDAGGYGSSP